jgi:putative hydrolase of the HAD superfamily
MEISYILLDLDNTIYPSSTGLLDEVGERMTSFVMKHFGLSAKKARELRKDFRIRYGATLTGLIEADASVDVEDFLEFTHPREINRYLPKLPELKDMLSRIALPMSVLTNSPMEHAVRVLEHLEIRDRFERIFDLRFNSYRGKPAKALYERVLAEIDRAPGEVLFVDDHTDYLESFRALGGNILLVDEFSEYDGSGGIPVIRRLTELDRYLEKNHPTSLRR